MRGTKKSHKKWVLYFQEQKQKVLAYNPNKNLVLEKINSSKKDKELQRAKILLKGN